jgi:hypothetical protein
LEGDWSGRLFVCRYKALAFLEKMFSISKAFAHSAGYSLLNLILEIRHEAFTLPVCECCLARSSCPERTSKFAV